MRRILVTGAHGQIGSELVPALRARYGVDRVVASDLDPAPRVGVTDGPYARMDCLERHEITAVMRRYDVGAIFHLAAMLSAVAEREPERAWRLNTGSLLLLLEAARDFDCQLFCPSSIAAFGPSTPRVGTPQDTLQRPATIYGVTKVAGELLCDYYASHFGVDVRGLRLPGLVSYVAPPGGGTTDYAVDMLRAAASGNRYTCYLAPQTRLDMMYMPDAIAAIIQLMEADAARLTHRNAYNVTAMSITPTQLAEQIRKHWPRFVVDYRVDSMRQAIAESWPQSLDDHVAREDWGFAPRFDLATMTEDMLRRLRLQSEAHRGESTNHAKREIAQHARGAA
jgi:nucleoside-diphosphate-sugar epimerase